MKYFQFIIVGLILSVGCGKQDTSVQTKTIDSLQHIISDLNGQVSNLNAFIAQQAPTPKQLTASSASTEQTSAVEEAITNKSPSVAWKEVRNGSTLFVKWKMKVFMGVLSQCNLIIDGTESSYGVNIYNSHIALHTDDVLIVTGEASDVDEMGNVIVHATKIINKGVE